MEKVIAWGFFALVFAGVVALVAWDRAQRRKRKARGEQEPDDETWIW